MVQQLLVAIATIVLVYVIARLIRFFQFRSQIDTIPGPKIVNLLVGNLDQMLHGQRGHNLLRMAKDHGKIYRFWIGPTKAAVVLSDPEYVKHVIGTNGKNYEIGPRITLRLLVGNGLLVSRGKFWKRQRTILSPAFHYNVLSKMHRTFANTSRELFGVWSEHLSRSTATTTTTTPSSSSTTNNNATQSLSTPPFIEKDVCNEFQRLTLDIIGRTAFGMEFNAIHHKESPTLTALINLTVRQPRAGDRKSTAVGMLHVAYESPVVGALAKLLAWKSLQRMNKVLSDLDEQIMDMIKNHTKTDDLLGLLISAKDPETGAKLSPKEIRDEIMSFLLAGHETTAHLLSWTVYLLSQNPHVREKLFDEIDSVLADKDEPSSEDLDKLEYLEMVLMETLRVYPPVPTIIRFAKEDDKIGPYFIPKGTIVFTPAYVMHRVPWVWPDPEVFKPERFSKENMKHQHPLAFIPFSHGGRSCIGRNFALLEAKVILSMMLRKYTLDLVEGHPVEEAHGIVLTPMHGLKMRIAERCNPTASTTTTTITAPPSNNY